MNTADLNLRDLEYVVAIARHQSFSKAAEACAVSQPALSKQIKVLERGLGLQLFERNQRQVLLTEAGQRFVEQATQVLDQSRKLLDATQPYREVLTGAFRLGVIASSCAYLVPHFLQPLRETYPALQLWIKEGLTQALIQELKQGRLDAVIAAQTVVDEALAFQPLFFEPFLLVSGPAQTFKKRIEITDLDPSHFLMLEDGHCLKDQTLSLCALKDREPIQFQASSLETLLQMTALGLGYCVIPYLAHPQNPNLMRLLHISEFKDPSIGRQMVLYTRKTQDNARNIQALTALIQSSVENRLSDTR